MKVFSIEVHYGTFSVEPTDAAALLDIASRMRPLTRSSWNQPYTVEAKGELPFTKIELVEFDPAGEKAEPPVEPAPEAAPEAAPELDAVLTIAQKHAHILRKANHE